MVLVGLGQAAHAGPPPSSPASAPAPALAAASGQYAVELTPDGRMTIRGTNALPASRAGAQAADEVVPLATWTYTFSKSMTNRIWNAFLNGSTAAIYALCVTVFPLPALAEAVGCTVISGAIRDFMDSHGNPNGRCLQISISTRIGVPPWQIRLAYVSC
jgi:tetrahydromethanopterin S-methyltransferase subunit C